jgi:hypothetical protein
MRDVLTILCARGPQKVHAFLLDPLKGHFFREISRHEDKLTCQAAYFRHYSQSHPELLRRPDDLAEVLGACFIHPTADIHPSALVSLSSVVTV